LRWIGQHIIDIVARFRSEVYLEDIKTSSDTDTLVINSEGRVYKNTNINLTGVSFTTDDETTISDTSGSADFGVSGGNGIDTSSTGSTITITAETASDVNPGVVELATTAETTTGTDATKAVTPDGLKDGYQGSTNVTTLGTIATGTWEGTAIAADQQKHLMHYQFIGYGTGDGTNYFTPMQMSDAQAPFEHDDASSSDGLTVTGGSGTNVSEFIRFGGHVMTRAATLKKWTGWASCNDNNNDYFIALFKWSPVDNNSTDISASHGGLTVLDTVTLEGKNNDKVRPITETAFTNASVAAGDIIFTQIKTSNNNKTIYFNTTLEVEFS